MSAGIIPLKSSAPKLPGCLSDRPQVMQFVILGKLVPTRPLCRQNNYRITHIRQLLHCLATAAENRGRANSS